MTLYPIYISGAKQTKKSFGGSPKKKLVQGASEKKSSNGLDLSEEKGIIMTLFPLGFCVTIRAEIKEIENNDQG